MKLQMFWKEMNLKYFDNTILLFGLGMFLFGALHLRNFKFENNFGDRGNPLAIVRKSNNTVKKKSAMNLGWADTWESEALFSDDQVFTFENSSADLEFLNGANIEVSEKTLFKIQMDKGVLNLDLAEGIIFARISKKSGPLLINIKNRQFKLESTSATVQLKRTENISEVVVVEGKATISNQESSIEARENQKLELTSSRLLSETPLLEVEEEVVIESEEEVITEFGDWDKYTGGVKIELRKPDQQVDFNWDGKSEDKFVFELSYMPNFEKNLITKKVSGANTKISFPKTGTFYWRAKKVDSNGNIVFQKPVKVIIKPTPPPEKPILEKEMRLKIKEKSSSIYEKMFELLVASSFAGDRYVEIPMPENEDAKSYLIEIYSDSDGKNLVVKGTTSESTWKWENPKAGVGHIRVSVVDFWDRQSPFSDLTKIVIEEIQIKKIEKVSLLSPYHGFKTVGDKVTFKWKSNVEGDYFLEISKDISFKNILVRRLIRTNSTTIESRDLPEKFYWRVKQGKGTSYKRRVQVIRGIQPKKKIVKKRIKKKKFRKKYKKLGVSFKPTMTDYTTTLSGSQVSVDGTALNGFEINYMKGRDDENGFYVPFYQVEFSRTAGEVFNTLKFHNQALSFSYGDLFHYLPFQTRLNVGANEVTTYTVSSTSVVEDSGLYFHGGVGALYPFRFLTQDFEFSLDIGFGTDTLFEIGLVSRKKLSKNLQSIIGLKLSSHEFETENGDAEISETSVLLGLEKLF
ncbi:MAG: FecR domain-containing protein [Bacteriovoracaceae bacterium]|nr:FecR domain-containing protein [Bacteriovoracaceae bacterium]